MVVAFVQSVISTRDENLPPLNKASRQEAGNHANDHLLRKCRVHCHFRQQKECHWECLIRGGEAQIRG
jgi:hypothetical protein